MPLFKAFTPHELKLDEAGAVSVAFAQLNVVDHDSDLTPSGAFPAKNVPMSSYGHTSWDGALPIGKGAISEKGDWAVFDGQFLMETDQGRNAYQTVKAMAELQEWSYGYLPTEFSYEQRDGQTIRILKSIDVFEVSPVLRGAGVATHTLAIKSGAPGSDAPYADHLDWVLGEVKALSDRSRDKAEWRAKEGRVLSAANRDRLAALVESLRAAGADLEDLVAATEPPKAAAARRTEIEVLLGLARANGVLIPT